MGMLPYFLTDTCKDRRFTLCCLFPTPPAICQGDPHVGIGQDVSNFPAKTTTNSKHIIGRYYARIILIELSWVTTSSTF
jgi:hypothetical protein